MSAISSKLPASVSSSRFGRLNVLNALLAAGIASAGVAAYLTVGTSSGTRAQATRTSTATKGVVLSTVSATGELQSAKQVDVNFTSAGQLVSVNVRAGQHVEKGQVLGRIDSTSAQQALQQAQTSLASAQAQYQTTLTGETATERRSDALSITQAQQSLANAKRTAAFDSTSSANSIAQAQHKLGVDQGQLKLDEAQYAKDKTPYATVDAAQAAVDADNAKLTADKAAQSDHQLNGTAQTRADQAKLTADQAQQYSDQQLQTQYQHQLNLDKTAQSAAADGSVAKTNATAAVNSDNDNLDSISARLQVDAHTITLDQNQLSADQSAVTNADSAAVSQDQTKLSADQASLSALQADEKSIRTDEQTIANDKESLTSTKQSAASTKARDAQSVKSAQLSLQTTRVSIASKQAPPTPSALASAKGSLVQAQIGLQNARTALADTILRAPIAGVVATVNGMVGTQASGGGSSIASTSSSSATGSTGGGSGFVTLTKLSGMQVVASFSETDAGKLRVDQPATVTVDAVPNKELAAHVLAIASTATASSSVVTYDATFALDRTSSLLKPGMTANVSVVTGEADNVVHVPTSAVRGSGRSATVTVLRNGKEQSVPVAVGLQGDSSTAILSGLKAGDTVVLPTVSLSTSGTSTTGQTGTVSRGGGGGLGGGGPFFGGGLGG